MSERNPETTEPIFTEAEYEEIMRLHIVDGLTISGAKLVVFKRRGDGDEGTRIVQELKL